MTDVDALLPPGARAVPNEPDLPATAPATGTATATSNGHHHPPKVAPHDLQAERSLIGAAMLGNPGPLLELDEAAFYLPAHGHIAHAIRALHDDRRSIDLVTVSAQLETTGLLDAAGGRPAVTEILVTCPATSNAGTYADIVRAHWRSRTIAHAAEELAVTVREQGPDAAHTLLRRLVDQHGPTAVPIDWEDVAAVVRGDYEPLQPTILTRSDGQALIYPGLLHWLMGEPGKGKTWVALHIAAEQITSGCHVLYLDWEGNRRTIGARLAALGCTDTDLDERLHYLRPPYITPAVAAGIAAKATTTAATVAILDGVAKALARNGYNEDKAPDVLAWLELLVQPLTDAGTATLLLDHVVKDKDNRGTWARGSGAKIGEVSGASWMVKPKTPFSRTQPGELHLIQTKDREGHVAPDGATVAVVRVTPQHDGDTVTILIDPPPTGGPGLFRPTGYMQQICSAIETLTDQTIPATTTKILDLVPGKKEHKRVALQRLIDEGHIGFTPAPRGALHHHVITPYRELDDPLSDRYQPTDNPPPEAYDDPPEWEDF